MPPPLRSPAAFFLAALLALPTAAQDDPDAPDDEAPSSEEGEVVDRDVVIERDGEVYRFRVPHPDADVPLWKEGGPPRFSRADTVIDGRHVIRFRTPGGEEETFEFEVPNFDAEDFRMRVLPEVERFRAMPPDLFFEHGGEPFGFEAFRVPELGDRFRLHGALSDETREAMMELERRAHELADEARRAVGREREELERELDDVLDQLFEVRGRMREEQAAHLEEQAEALRREAEALREEIRERERERLDLIEERKRELLGEHGSDW